MSFTSTEGYTIQPQCSILVAASNAPTWQTQNAKYTCDGTADDVQIQAAIDDIVAVGSGFVEFSFGTFTCSSTINWQGGVHLIGQGNGASHINSSAAVALQIKTGQSGGGKISHLHITGVGKAFWSNGCVATRLVMEQVWLDGGTNGYGYDVDAQWIECGVRDSIISQMCRITAGAVNNCFMENVRFNTTGNKPTAGYVFSMSPVGTSSCFAIKNCTAEVGGFQFAMGASGNLFNIAIENTYIADPATAGDTGISITGGVRNVVISNVMAENFAVYSEATEVHVSGLYCYSVDFQDKAGVFAWGVTTNNDTDLGSTLGANSIMEHEGKIYGKFSNKKIATIRVPLTAAGTAFKVALSCPAIEYTISRIGIITEANVTGNDTNYATLTFKCEFNNTTIGSYAFTLGNDATAYTKVIPAVYADLGAVNVVNNSIYIVKTEAGSGLEIPAATYFVEYWEVNTSN